MSAHRRLAKGFTLVEILIVVVILGILAAIVIPQFTSASESAKESSLVSQLQTIRSQLELFQVQHNGSYPDLSDSSNPWGPLTEESSADHTSAGIDSDGGDYGPYLQQAPKNPFTNGSTVASDNSGDWKYDSSTGEIQAVIPSGTSTNLDSEDYVSGS